MSSTDGTITKQAVGRLGFIGSLYDVRTDRFEGENLFNQELRQGLILTTDCAHTDYFVDENLSQKDTLNKLNIEGSLKLSLMAGLIKPESSVKYLNQTKTDSRTVRVTFMFSVKTKEERLQVSMSDLCKYFSSDALQNPYATHCVIGIRWGAHVAATFEETLATSQAAEELQGQLAASLKKITINISGQANLENMDMTNSNFHSLKISFSGDVMIPDVPRTVDDVFNIFKEVPSMVKQLNDGKGKQLEYELYPLERMAKIFKFEIHIERMIKQVTDRIINRIENIFEEMIKGKRMINDFLGRIELWEDYISSDWIQVIHDKQTELIDEELRIQCKIATLLGQIRSGEAVEEEVKKLLNEFNEKNPCSLTSIRQFLKENARIDAKISTLSRFDRRSVEGKNQLKKTNSDLLPKNFPSIDDFIFNYRHHDVYLLHIAFEWEQKDKTNWYQQLRCFDSLQEDVESLPESRRPIFRVIDHDLHVSLENKPNSCVIYHAYDGTIVTEDYSYKSLNTLSPEQIQAIREQNKFTSMKDKDIEEKYKCFIEAHPTGKMNKENLITVFEQLYPMGKPRHYCQYVFNVIDKNQNRTIEFAEYMIALSLTLPGDLEKQLTLTFAMCANDESEQVSSERLKQFLEAVEELKGIDSSASQSTVKKIMEYHRKEKSENIKKEDFIACLLSNVELCAQFLPAEVVSSTLKSNIDHNTKWIQNGLTIAGGNESGNGLHQLDLPCGVYVDDDQTIYVADCENHRIVEWKYGASKGQVVAGGNGEGNEMNQLNCPTDVIIDNERNNLIICDQGNRRVVRWSRRNGASGQIIISNIDCGGLIMNNNGFLYVSDREKDEVSQWKLNDTCGTSIAGGNRKENRLNQLNGPTFIFVDKDHSVYVSDCHNHRVMKWMAGAKEGIVVAGGQGKGNRLTQLSSPYGLIVDHLGSVYVADSGNHRIMRWTKGAIQGDIVVGGNGQGKQANQLSHPTGLSFDRQGNLYVVDYFNHRVQNFTIDRS